MAINPAMRAALKALSYPEPDIKKSYKIERQVEELAKKPKIRLFYKTWDHQIPCGDHSVTCRIFTPPTLGNHPALLFFHGGGWVKGNIDSYDQVCRAMAQITNHLVISVDYRLAPEHPFPAPAEDCYAVARELFLHPELLHIPPEEITLIGDSAGGNLAAAVSLMARDRGEFLPFRQILIYPATHFDHSDSSPFPSVLQNGTDYLLTSRRLCDYFDLYSAGQDYSGNPYFAPITAKDLSRQPKTLIITAQYDPLRDEGEAYGRRLEEAGNSVEVHRIEDALHGFFALPPRFEHVKQAYRLINGFLGGTWAPEN